MEIKINKEKCLICGGCVGVEPQVFKFSDDGFIEIDNNKINEENINDVEEAIENCPVGAIEKEEEDEKISE